MKDIVLIPAYGFVCVLAGFFVAKLPPRPVAEIREVQGRLLRLEQATGSALRVVDEIPGIPGIVYVGSPSERPHQIIFSALYTRQLHIYKEQEPATIRLVVIPSDVKLNHLALVILGRLAVIATEVDFTNKLSAIQASATNSVGTYQYDPGLAIQPPASHLF